MTDILFRPKALHRLRRVSRNIKKRIKAAVETLEQGRLPPHTKKLEGSQRGYRIRIGRWRMLFTLTNNEIEIIDVFVKKGDDDYKRRIL
jgi:mRNA interferase RelE/StbE